jgi:DNA-binding NtrC family response regulator
MSTMARWVLKKGARVITAETVEKALPILRSGQGVDLILIDGHCPIAELVQSLQTERMHVPIIAYGEKKESSIAVRAIQAGAQEYLPLPPDPELLSAILESVTPKKEMLIARDSVSKKVLQLAKRVAISEANVLITGESGTGKEVLARYIQRESARAARPFVAINCAAIPEALLESELFGHEKGAFTGAVARRIGKFEEANEGTLLLDEISEMHPLLQGKLLRTIQEREICRIGGNRTLKINIRLLATSNRDLSEEVKKGNFREDLFYRLNVINIEIPPLRKRKEDILPLAEHFAKKYCKINGIEAKSFTESACLQLQRYAWPGNVRELENIIHRTVLLSDGALVARVEAIPDFTLQRDSFQMLGCPSSLPSGGFVGRTIPEIEQSVILETLRQCLGNKTHAARILGISIRTLRNKLHSYEQSALEEEHQKEVACL